MFLREKSGKSREVKIRIANQNRGFVSLDVANRKAGSLTYMYVGLKAFSEC